MKSSKHVLMVLETDFPPDIRVENEIEALSKAGYKTTILCLTRNKNRKSYEIYSDHLTVFRKKIPVFFYKSKVGQPKFPFYDLFWKRFIKSYLKNNTDCSYDIIHVHDLSLASIGLWLKKRLNKKLILDLHENYPYLIKDSKHTQKGLGKLLSDFKLWVKFEKEVVPKSDYVICVVEEMYERLKEFDNRPDNYHIYQNVVNLNSVNPYTEPKRNTEFKLIYIGGITPARGLQNVIKAIDLLKREHKICFEIYGSGSYLPDLINLTKSLQLEKNVHLMGKIPQKDVFDKIVKSDAAIIPHLKSVQNDCSSPNKLYQYLSSGRAVISSDCNSIKRVIEENKLGKTYQDNNPKDLASVLSHLISNPEERIKYGKRGHKLVLEKFNTKVEGDKLVEFYNKI